ncbi:hypothetical protein RFI_05841 [Reticulomyxa filosa]|uniref:Uncharacterized protein n=1 Tax=Reticulomyxa filosa TaxID=46433 RepID=X6NZH1_RETFI|nr:hypothetical protein RFI_05841 [Reticulomyxa filosa]|eukprot:ETO31278.1 hypothetical protein RFI_05841 [Reticulomyxa filosa]
MSSAAKGKAEWWKEKKGEIKKKDGIINKKKKRNDKKEKKREKNLFKILIFFWEKLISHVGLQHKNDSINNVTIFIVYIHSSYCFIISNYSQKYQDPVTITAISNTIEPIIRLDIRLSKKDYTVNSKKCST